MKVLDLFSGIGGMALGMERAGMHVQAFCEKDEWCRQVLAMNFPGRLVFPDIENLTYSDGVFTWGDIDVETGPIDVICGGYPCQPFSLAGDRRGTGDDRHLWPEMLRLISAVRPNYVVCENVTGHVTLGLDEVLSDLAGHGYATEAFVLPAAGVGAWHRRDRVFVIAYLDRPGLSKREREETMGAGPQCWTEPAGIFRWPGEPDVGRVADGVPGRVDRLKALGNAVVPALANVLGDAIMHDNWVCHNAVS